MYDFVIRFHYVVSTLFVLIAIIVVAWAIYGWINKSPYSRVFNRLSFFLVHLLYLQLITGVILYFFLKPDPAAASWTLDEAMKKSSLRFWAIEHVSLMAFALILSQIGRLLMKEISLGWRKFRSATLYFGISLIVVLTSAAVALLS